MLSFWHFYPFDAFVCGGILSALPLGFCIYGYSQSVELHDRRMETRGIDAGTKRYYAYQTIFYTAGIVGGMCLGSLVAMPLMPVICGRNAFRGASTVFLEAGGGNNGGNGASGNGAQNVIHRRHSVGGFTSFSSNYAGAAAGSDDSSDLLSSNLPRQRVTGSKRVVRRISAFSEALPSPEPIRGGGPRHCEEHKRLEILAKFL